MDIFEKLDAALEPLGDRLFIDDFTASLRAAREAAAREQAQAARRVQEEARSRPEPRPARPEPRPAGQPRPDSDDDEVSTYMNRNRIEGVDEDEIQEFLRERSGFIPMDDEQN